MTIAFLPFVSLFGAIVPVLLGRYGAGRAVVGAGAAAVNLAALALLLAGGIGAEHAVPWIPALGIDYAIRIDALAFFFAALILGIGLLIVTYATFYLPSDRPTARFHALLLMFQGAMAGVVTSDDLILLVLFWELTSLTSFLLIGYSERLSESRRGARMALTVTGAGGLLLLAGFVLLGEAAGTYRISEILAAGDAVKASPLYPVILLLVLAGAFTKSAQFPFHFWLPRAMAAPTPVSAYLHSATMVKAGVFLLARLWPALAGTELWTALVAPVGLATMLIGAWIALFRIDLKAVLAYSTVSHLGLMVMLLGFGTPYAAIACVFHILNHASFKAALFMSAGIVDHETGTRDIGRLGGLFGLMPIAATLGVTASAAMAGLPLLNGFLSKEMMLEASAEQGLIFAALATVAALLSVVYSLRFAAGVYLGPRRTDFPRPPHDPGPGLWGPVLVLVLPVVAIGLAPGYFAEAAVLRIAQAVTGAVPLPDVHLALWHGVTPALLMSALAFAGGFALLARPHALDAFRRFLPEPDAERIFDRTVGAAVGAGRAVSAALHTDSLPRYLAAILVTVVAVGAAGFLTGTHGPGPVPLQPVNPLAVVIWVVTVATCAAVLFTHQNRFWSLVLTGVVGLAVSLTFIQFSAPDLALTQISVEVVTTILLLLALNLLPRRTRPEPSPRLGAPRLAFAAVAGLGVAGLCYAMATRRADSISAHHLALSKPEGGGTNVVNVILVDFRGFDTYGEIIVLCIAALTIFALLDGALKGAAARRLAAMRQRLESADAHPLLLVVVTRALLPLALVVAVHLFLRGHNQPGGGFIAGLVAAVALLMQAMASGYAWAAQRRRLNAHTLLGWGVLIAGLTGLASAAFDHPFLTSTFGYVTLPIVGTFEIASAMAFDLGVFLAVVGTVILSLSQIARVEARAERSPVPEGPSDISFPEDRPAATAVAASRTTEA